MKVTQSGFLDFLGQEGMRLAIPAYQRLYSWSEVQCEELWLDVLRAARAGRSHFLGTVLYCAAPRGDRGDGARCFEVIDGQQRVMTVSLAILALAQHLEAHPNDQSGGCVEGRALRARYLIMGEAVPGPVAAKLVPARHDSPTYEAALEGGALDPASPIARNLGFFRAKMGEDGFDPLQLLAGLRQLAVVLVEVGDSLEAQPIFESINSKGVPLNVADMVRNYLLLAESHDEQARLYEEYWKPSQEMFAPDPGSLKLNVGIKSWLSIRLKGARILSAEQTYSSFKRYVEDAYQGDKEPILRELRGFCLMWAESYRYHGVKRFRSGSDWAELGAPTLTAGYALKRADDEEYARRYREKLRNVDSRW